MIFDTIPTTPPATPLLDQINAPSDLRELGSAQLAQLADELRAFLLYSVGQTGGHFGAGLGVVELTIALHSILNTPEDQLIWDVGHQAYPHKILTGRRSLLHSIRQLNGLAAFPKRNESTYDSFGVGHSSTSISAALGMAIARDLNGDNYRCVAVIGDGAITAGMAYEALNHAGHTKTNMLIILNDNSMSISENTGGLSAYLANMHNQVTATTEPALIPSETIFEDLGLTYLGPVDGHDLSTLPQHIEQALSKAGPILLHIKTQKGYGYAPALNDPIAYHALTKIEAKTNSSENNRGNEKKYQSVFGDWLCDTASKDEKLVAITPAMKEGSGMSRFADTYPHRFFDVAIAEQHALTFAAGLACQKRKPVVAIYSTFLQRAYDQLIHDIALQNLDVTFAIDRAGLVGADGPTHAGMFDLTFLNCIPNLVIAAPSGENECRQLLNSAYGYHGPAAVRYPRGRGPGEIIIEENQNLEIGKARPLLQGSTLCILNFGALLHEVLPIAKNRQYSVIDMRWVKPLDEHAIREATRTHRYLITLEENTVVGGVGCNVQRFLQHEGIPTPMLNIGLEDKNLDQGSRAEQLAFAGLDTRGIAVRIDAWLEKLREIK